jgi:uncharacterized protein YkwD
MRFERSNQRQNIGLAAVALLGLLSSACMLEPFDQKRVESKQHPVSFQGVHFGKNSKVTIQARDPVYGDWETIGSATSSDRAYLAFHWTGSPQIVYPWVGSLVVPDRFWQARGGGHRLQVRAVAGSTQFLSVRDDWQTCYSQSGGPTDFINDCAAPDTPVANVLTRDYQPVPDNGYCAEVSSWPDDAELAEEEVVRLVNQHRASGATCNGVYHGPTGPLTMDPVLRCAARKHSKDMDERSYYSHVSPEGQEVEARMDLAGHPNPTNVFRGENIDMSGSAAQAVSQWMKSELHCKNIMNPAYDHIGVGNSGLYWTQVFAG